MKFRKKKCIPCRTNRVLPVLFLVCAVLLFPVSPVSAEGVVTEQNIRDAIIGGKNFNDDQLKEMDRNNDGKLDVADLVKYIKSINPGTPVVGFEAPDSTAAEGIGTARVRVSFSESFSGTLAYTTTVGDAAPVSRTISVEGITADIPVSVADDLTVTDGQMITVSLASGTGYAVGAFREHLLSISDDDAAWYGQIRFKGMSIGFDMEILQEAGSSEARLISDGTKGITQGEWPVDFSMTDNTFYARIGPIELPSGSIADSALLGPFGTTFQRVLVLEASNASDSSMVQPNSRIIGKMTDTFSATAPDRQYLKAELSGVFILEKEISGGGTIR